MLREQEEELPATGGEGDGSLSKQNGSDITEQSGKHDAGPGPDTGQKTQKVQQKWMIRLALCVPNTNSVADPREARKMPNKFLWN